MLVNSPGRVCCSCTWMTLSFLTLETTHVVRILLMILFQSLVRDALMCAYSHVHTVKALV